MYLQEVKKSSGQAPMEDEDMDMDDIDEVMGGLLICLLPYIPCKQCLHSCKHCYHCCNMFIVKFQKTAMTTMRKVPGNHELLEQ